MITEWTNGAQNEVVMDGILNEVNLKPGTDLKTGQPTIFGDFTIKTTNTIDGKDFISEIPIRVYQKEKTLKGTNNPAYDNALRIMNDFVSVAAGGEKNADYVRIASSGSLGENAFISKNSGMLISGPVVRASFINKIKKSEAQNGAKFKVVIVIGQLINEINKAGEETGRLIIKGILPQYNNKVDVIDFIVENPKVINHVQNNWQQGDTVLIGGYINFTSKVDEVEEPNGFGEPIITRRTKTVRELIVTGGHESPLTDEEGAYDSDSITKAINERKERLEKKKEEAASAPATKTPMNFGF